MYKQSPPLESSGGKEPPRHRSNKRAPQGQNIKEEVSQMHKKIITACLALVALAAFALPATASAATDPQITHPTGTLLNPTGKECTGNPGICIVATQVCALTKLKSTDNKNTLLECTSAT